MAQFKLKITGSVSELALIGHGLFLAGLSQPGVDTPTAEPYVEAAGRIDNDILKDLPWKEAPEGSTVYEVRTALPETEAVAAADKPKRTRKASAVDTPATGAETFAAQIKEVVAGEAANPTPAPTSETTASQDQGPTSSSGESQAVSGDATSAAASPASSTADATSATERPADLKAACQDLVKKLMSDSRYQTADILKALEAFGGKGVTAIADNAPDNLGPLFDKLTSMAAV